MSKEDNDNLYVLEEEDPDHSPLNFAAYEDDEREEEVNQEEISSSKKSPFAHLIQIMFNPVQGWKTLRRSKISVESLQSSCFYPLLALLAISNFADFFYSVNVNLSQVITLAVVSFVSFFFGYFCIQMVLNWFLPKEVANIFENKFGKEYILISLSTLALFTLITNLLPMLWPILIFLPIWTLYLMFKAVRFFKFQIKEEMKFFVLSGSATIGIPLLIDWGLNAILPY
ncbi:MAG: hypothetical protein J1E16_10545 [Muribaculaceae bacterium]|nr:hypothetical protein [Muribaculaceae bacterium]